MGRKFILSVDGGGMRGILPSLVLAGLEARLKKPLAETFDLLTGSSTGGVIVAALCTKDDQGKPKYTASQMLDFYKEMGPKIFKERLPIFRFFKFTKYRDENVKAPLRALFGDTTFKNTLSHLLIPSFDLKTYTAVFFKNWRPIYHDVGVSDIVRATAAAPTFFNPVRLRGMMLTDASVVANNPAVCGYAQGRKLFPGEDLVMLAIGTGRHASSPALKPGLGSVAWVAPLVHAIFASSQHTASYQMRQLIGDRYIRLNRRLTQAESQLDDASPENIYRLELEGRCLLEESEEQIEKFIKYLNS